MPNNKLFFIPAPIIISIFIFLFLFFPISSFASPAPGSFVPAGPCYFSDTPSQYSSGFQKCPLDPNLGQEVVHLKWDVPGDGNSYCVFESFLAQNEWPIEPGYKSIGQFISDSVVASSGGRRSNDNNDLIVDHKGDMMFIYSEFWSAASKAGTEPTGLFRVNCCHANNTGTGCLNLGWPFSPATHQYSQTIEINNYPKCEVPFSEIIDNLKSGIYTPITESGFKSWATDDVDNVSNNPDKNGSGDKTDLISAMSTQQECYQLGPLSPNLNPVALPAVKQRIASYTDRGYPIMIYYHIFTKIVLAKNLATQLGWQLADNDTYIKSIGYHALVALNVTDTSGFPNYAFDLQVLDPNDYKLDTLNCSTKIFEIGGPRLAVCTSATMDNEIMDYLSEVEASIIAQAKEAKIYVTLYDDHEYDVIGGSESVYIRTREDKCNAQPSLNFCQQTPVERLSNDIPEIPNRNISTGGGICKAWSYLTLVVAYLGDFNFDFHRGDDKVIGRDCDEIYRYPIPSNIVAEVKKSPLANKVNWLGSIYSSYSNWLGSISGSLSKLWPFK